MSKNPLTNCGGIAALLAAAVLAGCQTARTHKGEFTLNNGLVSVTCTTEDGALLPGTLLDKKTGQKVDLGAELFSLTLTNGEVLRSGQFKLAGESRVVRLPINANASRLAERLPGRELVADLTGPDGSLQAQWHVILRDGSRYLREEVVIKAGTSALPLKSVGLLETTNATARPTGTVDGSPVADQTTFYGVEHPLSINRASNGVVRCFLPRGAAMAPGESFACSQVIGFVRPGQLRRDFLAYLERERAHPYRPFLHYNSWYDIAYFGKYDEAAALNVINAFGQELVVKRGVKLDSYLFDDGWDDNKTLWQFQFRFSRRLCPAASGGGEIRRGPGHLAFAVGRIRPAAHRAHSIRPGAGI